MSFCDPSPPPPPLPFMPPSFPAGNVGGIWSQFPLNNEHPESHLRFEHEPPLKRPRDSENNPPNFAHFRPMNPRMNPQNPPVNKGTGHIFYKTRMCMKFLEGNCRNGENCTFAHGFEDMREPPPNWQELIREKDRAGGNWNDDHEIIHRMKICKKFYNGEECPYGGKCNFLHESPSKFKTCMETPCGSSAVSIANMGPTIEHRSGTDQPELNKHLNASSDASRVNMKPAYWKTKICSKWEATGHCPFGERCHFAHGLSDLQVPGGRIEAEMMSNIVSITTKRLSVPIIDAPSPVSAVDGAPAEERESKKCLSKWKIQKKMSRIYADWIDDLMPPHSLPSKLQK